MSKIKEFPSKARRDACHMLTDEIFLLPLPLAHYSLNGNSLEGVKLLLPLRVLPPHRISLADTQVDSAYNMYFQYAMNF